MHCTPKQGSGGRTWERGCFLALGSFFFVIGLFLSAYRQGGGALMGILCVSFDGLDVTLAVIILYSGEYRFVLLVLLVQVMIEIAIE